MKTIATAGNSCRQHTDEQLISLAIDGHQRACNELFRRYERLVRFVIRRYLTDPEAVKDTTQDTFLRAFRALPDFRGESKLGTWLGRIASSLALNRLRIRWHQVAVPLDDHLMQWHDDSYNGGMTVEKAETMHLVQQSVRQLRSQDAMALELFYLREQSIEEIGRITGWTASKTKSRLSRARHRLREVLVSEGLSAEAY